ncbi:MAG: hypothetical protein FJX76_06045 [Armatimonadetes bacterium]|nr:hypothetical protein [Armatimonadota bacterium]
MKRRARGLSLVEVQLALLLLLVGILTAVGLAPLGMRGAEIARRNTLANDYARELIEEVRATPFSRQKNGNSDPNGEGYTYTLSISTPATNVNLHEVQADVYYQDPGDSTAPKTRLARLVTYTALYE